MSDGRSWEGNWRAGLRMSQQAHRIPGVPSQARALALRPGPRKSRAWRYMRSRQSLLDSSLTQLYRTAERHCG